MRLRDVMTHSVHTLTADQSVASAIHLFIQHGIKGAPVLLAGKLVGVVSEKDIFRALYPSVTEFSSNPELWLQEVELEGNAKTVAAKPVSEIMVTDSITATPDTPVMQAGSMMLAHNVSRILVVESGKLLGIATRSDVFRSVFKQFLS
ncbi:MAG: CBS domain-containing protein [Patescibacteria group bacterium]